MANLLAELKRRHIYRVAAAYAVVAWVLIQLVNNITPMLKLPDWVGTVVLVLLGVGFPIALIFAWILQIASTEGATGRTATGKLDGLFIGALVVVIALVSYQQLAPMTGARTAQQQASGAAVTPGGISVAVLPFANVSGDATQEFFSDGMTDEIMSALAKVSALRVVGRESAFQFKGQKTDMSAVGQALHATYLIEGSVRKAGDQVRITAQLVQADNGVSVWTESYDREMKNIFATQSDIATAIAGALRVPLGLRQGDTLVHDRTSDLQSYDQYLRAKALVRGRGLKPLTDAAGMLEGIVKKDPEFAAAWALLAQAYVSLPGYSAELRGRPNEAARRIATTSFNNVERTAREAIRLDQRDAVAYAALARNKIHHHEFAEAENLFRQALALDSSDPDVLYEYALMLNGVGRVTEALGLLQKLRVQEPFAPIYTIVTARSMIEQGHAAESIPLVLTLPADAAGGVGRNSDLAQAYASEGRFQEAADALLLMKGGDLFSPGTIDAAAALLRTAPATAKDPAVLPILGYGLNFIYAYVGALERMMEANEDALENGYGAGTTGLWHPRYAPLRRMERFKTYVRKIGLVDYWRARGWPDLCRPMGADDFVCD